MGEEAGYIGALNQSVIRLMRKGLARILTKPSLVFFLCRVIGRQKRAAVRRAEWEEKGYHIPPFLIMSVTRKCNLNCIGCYSHEQKRAPVTNMNTEQLCRVLGEADELGISIILLAGGEPFIRDDLLSITAKFPRILFPVFTNGLLLNNKKIKSIERQKNVIPIISLEGFEKETDGRRGGGVYENAQKVFSRLKNKNVLFGIILTVTRENFDIITDEDFIKKQIKTGCKILFYVEYVPVKKETGDLVVTDDQRRKLEEKLDYMERRYSSLFISFPGDEEKYGGCLSAGRGFAHISPDGRVEPCPFAPYSDADLNSVSLKDALQSQFLKKIRSNYRELSETSSGCALWEKREWVESTLAGE